MTSSFSALAAPRPPKLRRLGYTGLTVPEVGLAVAGIARDVAEVAWRLGVRYFDGLEATTPPSLDDPGGEALLVAHSDVGAGGSASWSQTPAAELDVIIADGPIDELRTPGFAEAVRTAKEEGRFRALGARAGSAAEIRALIGLGIFDAIELPFGISFQQPLVDSAALLRDWGGAVILSLSGSRHRVDGHDTQRRLAAEESAARAIGRSRLQLAVQAGLLLDAVSVVVVPSQNTDEMREAVGCSHEVPALTPADLRAADERLARGGITSRLAAVGEVGPRRSPGARTLPRDPDRPVGPARRRSLSDAWSMGSVRVPNRIVRSGATERAVDADGVPTWAMRACHEALAAGGAGMVITGYLAIGAEVRASMSHGVLQRGAAVDAWRGILDSCRTISDTVFCAQLGHGGALAFGDYEEKDLVRQYRDAAHAAAEAGFKAVQLHGAHGYFLGQLLAQRPFLRHGARHHRGLDLVRQVVEAVCDAVADDLAVLLKLNCSDFLADGYDQRDALVAVRALADSGVHGVEWSGWVPKARPALTPSRHGEVETGSEGFFLPFAAQTKNEHPHLAIGTCGGFRSSVGMTRAVADRGLDFVSLARPLIAEPDLPRRVLNGTAHALCDGCNECLAKHVRPLHCPRALVPSSIGEGRS